jgi:prephenate dehydrogenase
LIGGSIGLAARRQGAQVSGYDSDPDVREAALALGALDAVAADVGAAVADADAVFVATPLRALSEVVRAALEQAGPDCVVSDVGSTKAIVAEVGSDQRFVGGHPLAGAETAGVGNARANLFEGATWYLTPRRLTSGVLYERLHRLLAGFGAQPAAIDAEVHDRLMACVSHLPHVFANLLVEQAATQAEAPDARGRPTGELMFATGPSFREATRVAGANSGIWTDIYISNRHPLSDAVEEALRQLENVREMLLAADAPALTEWNERARARRDELLQAAAGEGDAHELRVAVPNRPGVIADIALALGRAGVNIVDMTLTPSRDYSQGTLSLWVRGEGRLLRAEELIAALDFPVVRA